MSKEDKKRSGAQKEPNGGKMITSGMIKKHISMLHYVLIQVHPTLGL